jgi:hypothetical protein
VDKYDKAKRLKEMIRPVSIKEIGRFYLSYRRKTMKEIKRGDIYYAALNPVVGSEQAALVRY